MSGQFPYPGGAPPMVPNAGPTYNGAGPVQPGIPPPGGKPGMTPAHNGPPYGAPSRPPFQAPGTGPPQGQMQPPQMGGAPPRGYGPPGGTMPHQPPSSVMSQPPNPAMSQPSSVAGPFPGMQPPTSQFNNMSMNNQPRPGMRPVYPPDPQSQPQHPPNVQSYGLPMGGAQPPPSSMAGPPQRGMAPGMYTPRPGMNVPSTGVRPPTSGPLGPAQPTSMGHPHGGMPPQPPTSMQHPPIRGPVPPSSGTGMPLPPSSMGGVPMSQPGMGAPPSSFHSGGMMPPPPSSAPHTMPPHMPQPGVQNGMPSSSMAPPSSQYMHPPQGQDMNLPPMPSGPMNAPFPGAPPTQPGQFPGSQTFNQQPMGYGGPGQPQQQNMQPPSAQRKLDPDQMPSPIQVIEDDRRNHAGVFRTDTKGSVPPLVTTNFITQDQGNANPRFIRSTMYNIPCTADLMKSSHIPFALAVNPFADLDPQEQPPPIVDLGEVGPVRCKRCKAYMNPFMQFIDGGRRFQCVFCGASTDVPNEYFAHLDHTGRRVDCYNKPELCLGSYEFVATKDYCKNGVPPKEPAFIFMIDVSYSSVKSGLVQLICDRLKSEILVNLPKETGAAESEIRVGFVTYHKELHFYNVKSSLAQPQMLIVSDLEDMFVPLVDGFLVKLSESEAVINSLLTQIPQIFAESKETELVLGPVIQAGLDALKSSDRSGRLYIFHSGLPAAEAPGKIKNRDDRKLLGTEKEKTLLGPQTTFYNKLGVECVAAGCSVDLFLFPNQYIDIATISDVCRITSGNIYKYSYFQADLDGERFIEDLKHTVMRSQAFDAILRVRTSTGIRPVDFYGNFYMANTTDVEMASVDSDASIGLEIKHDDKLTEAEGAYIQVAVLYTSVGGQRRLRCHNLALNCCTQMADLFRSCELDVLINYFAKQALRTILNANPKQMREHIMNEVAQILACYRKNCANPSTAGQLVLPECMKLLPLYANCVIRSDSVSGGSEISTDDRSYLMHLVNSMDVKDSNVFFYPRLLPFHTLDMESNKMPTAIRCSVDRLEDTGIYLLDNGLAMFLWIGHSVSNDMIQKIFSVQSAAQVDIDKVQLIHLDNPVSRRLNDLVTQIREERSRYLKLTIVRQRDKLQPWFDHFLVEDKGLNAGSSYVDFLIHIHKEIRNILS